MRRKTKRQWHKWIVALLIILALVAAAIIFWPKKSIAPSSNSAAQGSSGSKSSQKSGSLPIVDAQPTVDAWAAKQSGKTSVVVYDLANQKYVAQLNADRQYFTASLYKIYVAYIGYQKIADGTYSMSDPYLSGYNRGECLDAMIRISYSPCGEKMWNELGKSYLTSRMKDYGLKNTDLTGLYTSAKDASIILARLFEKQDLSAKYAGLYLDSMKTQPALYRRGLPSGFSHSTVYNKVGWNLELEWHDASIVTLPNGRSYVVCALTSGVGYRNVAALGRALEAKLDQ